MSPEVRKQKIINQEAQALFIGTTTLAKLLDIYDKDVIQEIIRYNNRLNSDDLAYVDIQRPEPRSEVPNLSEICTIVVEYKKIPKTEFAEGKFISLVNVLKRNYHFNELFKPYNLLIKEKPDWTEIYEMKAVNDFIELYPELISN